MGEPGLARSCDLDTAPYGDGIFNQTVPPEPHKDAIFATYVCPQICDVQREELEQLLLT